MKRPILVGVWFGGVEEGLGTEGGESKVGLGGRRRREGASQERGEFV